MLTPIDAFLAKRFEIESRLERLTALCDNHFGVAPEDINWGTVGSLDRLAKLLREAESFWRYGVSVARQSG